MGFYGTRTVGDQTESALDQLNGALIKQATDLFPGSQQERFGSPWIVGLGKMFGMHDAIAPGKPLSGLEMEAATHSRQQGLFYRFLDHGVGKLEILAVGNDQAAGDQTGRVELFIVDQVTQSCRPELLAQHCSRSRGAALVLVQSIKLGQNDRSNRGR
jgi:hypothetical protein